MKKIFIVLAVAALAVAVLFSCNKESDNSTPVTFPSHLCGAWSVYYDTTGANGALVIKDVLGGQYASLFLYASAEDSVPVILSGAFEYDSQTGKGELKDTEGLLGGYSFVLQAQSGTDHIVTMIVYNTSSKVSYKMVGASMTEIDFPDEGLWKYLESKEDGTYDSYRFGVWKMEAGDYLGALYYEKYALAYTDFEFATFTSSAFGGAAVGGEFNQSLPTVVDSALFYLVDVSKFYKSGDGYTYGFFTVVDSDVEEPTKEDNYYLPIRTNASFSQVEVNYDGKSILLSSSGVRPDPYIPGKEEKGDGAVIDDPVFPVDPIAED